MWLDRRRWTIACAIAAFALAGDARATAPSFPGVITTTLDGSETNVPVPDSGSLVMVLTSELAGVVVDADVTVDVTHPSGDQLDMYLIAPSGRTVTLTTDNGGANDDVFAGTRFDDQAAGTPSAPNVRNVTYTNLVATGPIQPEGALAAVVGEPAAGPWVLVVVDDAGGGTGMLHAWSLTLSTLPVLPPAAPVVDVAGSTGAIPDNDPNGLAATATVAGLGRRLLDVDVTVSITHPNAAHLDLFLTSPAGTRIDLATDVGSGIADLYDAVTFDDSAAMPLGDVNPLPPTGPPLTAVVPEGALGAFVGEDPNGTWTLTVVDDTGGGVGTLDAWTLHVTAVAKCGDGFVDPGEVCDDGNGVDGDGCDQGCVPSACGNGIRAGGEECDDGNTVDGDGCSSTCKLAESSCDDCTDDDGNGLVDGADPACREGDLGLRRVVASSRGVLNLRAIMAVPDGAAGPVSVLLADANGVIACTSLGTAVRKGRKLVAIGGVAGGTLTATMRGGLLVLKGRGLDLAALDDANLTLAIDVGGHRFGGAARLRTRGSRRVYP